MRRGKYKFLERVDLADIESDLSMTHEELAVKYRLSYTQVCQVLKLIYENRSKKMEKIKMPAGYVTICRTIKEVMPDIECLYREGRISDLQFSKYKNHS